MLPNEDLNQHNDDRGQESSVRGAKHIGTLGPVWDLLERYGIGVAAIAWVILLSATLYAYRSTMFTAGTAKAWLVLLSALLVLVGANRAIFQSGQGDRNDADVRYTIAFNAVIAIVTGLAVVIVACKDWAIPFLISIACVLIAGFFGLLFGYPSGVAQQPGDKDASAQARQKSPAQDRNLLAESASTLGKFLAGVTLARARDVSGYFHTMCLSIAPAFDNGSNQGALLAGSTLAYFLATGFLSGLLLPSYFMSGKFAE